MSSSPLRRHSLAIGTDGTPSKRPHQLGTSSSPTQGTRSVSSSSALPVLSQGRSFSPSVNNAPRSANSVGSPFPTRLVKVPSRDQLGEAPGSPSLDRNRDVVADEGHVQVVLRIRPSFTPPESEIPQRFQRVVLRPAPGDPFREVAVQQPEAVHTANKAKSSTFRYDRILPEECTQFDAYKSSAKPAMEKFLKGFNVTILAYGQTSSGKSYTMGTTGTDTDYTIDSSRTGIIPRAVKDMFGQLEQEQRQAGASMTWECKVSFLELYNEDLIDLLSTSAHNQTPPITIREDKGKIIWSGLREVTVTSIQQVMQLLHDGSTRRQVGETGMNKESSRSHAVFSLSLVQKRRSEPVRSKNFSRPMSMAGSPYSASPRGTPANTRPGSRTSMLPPPSNAIRQFSTPSTPGRGSPDDDALSGWVEIASKFHFVDLAGSERLKRTAAHGERMKEGISINAGLTALGNVISALAEPASKQAHIPYRDSKLTRLLQDSLGGNSYTIMIACVSPIEYNLNETINTLRYGARARNIKNRAEANRTEVGWDDLVHLQGLVVKLRKDLETVKRAQSNGIESPGTPSSDEATAQARLQLAQEQQFADSLRSQVQAQNLEIARLIKQVQTYKQGGINLPDTDGMTFSQMVEPIIDEYERTIVHLEAEIERYKAALQISETIAEQHSEQIALKNKRLEAQETYIHELRTRITKYARELESQVQTTSTTGGDDDPIMRKLKEELQRQTETLALKAAYLNELESRLETSDDRIEDLTRQIAELEQEAKHEGRPGLQGTIDLDQDIDENERLRDAPGEKDSRLRELQCELDQALAKCAMVAGEREGTSTSKKQTTEKQSNADDSDLSTKLPGSPVEPTIESEAFDRIDIEYSALKKEHVKTLADLTAMNAQYQKALADINRLALQLEKTNFQNTGSSSGQEKGKDAGRKRSPGETIDASSDVPHDDDEKKEDQNQRKTDPVAQAAQDFQTGRGQSKVSFTRDNGSQQRLSSSSLLCYTHGTSESLSSDAIASALLRHDPRQSGNDALSQAETGDEDNLRLVQVNGDLSLSSIAGFNLPTPSYLSLGALATSPSRSAARSMNSQEMVITSSEATLVDTSSPSLHSGGMYTEQDDRIKQMQQQLIQAQAEVQEKIGQLQSAKRNLENSDRNLRKLRVSVQEAYASRDVAISKATSLERELAQLPSEMASMRDSSVAHGRALERKLSEERRAKAQTQSEELDAEQKSKFRCF